MAIHERKLTHRYPWRLFLHNRIWCQSVSIFQARKTAENFLFDVTFAAPWFYTVVYVIVVPLVSSARIKRDNEMITIKNIEYQVFLWKYPPRSMYVVNELPVLKIKPVKRYMSFNFSHPHTQLWEIMFWYVCFQPIVKIFPLIYQIWQICALQFSGAPI